MTLLRAALLTLPLLLACGDKAEEDAVCEGGTETDGLSCSTEDVSPCEVTCVCADGELDTEGCLSGECMSVETVCGTGCPNFGKGEWTGDWCNG